MLGKVWTLAVAAAVAGVLALPAPAAYAQGTPAKPAATKPMAAKKPAHKRDCYDLAWQSAAMNDCLAKQGTAGASGEGMAKPMKKSMKKKKKMTS